MESPLLLYWASDVCLATPGFGGVDRANAKILPRLFGANLWYRMTNHTEGLHAKRRWWKPTRVESTSSCAAFVWILSGGSRYVTPC